MTRGLLQLFHHDFEQPVWKLAVDAGDGLIAIELRSAQDAQVSFSLLDLTSKTLLFDKFGLEEDWWVSLEAIQSKRMLLKQYHDSQQPEKQALLAIDIEKQEVAWWYEHFQLNLIGKGMLSGWVESEGDKEAVVLDFSTGEAIRDEFVVAPAPATIAYPQHYPLGSPYNETVRDFLAGAINQAPVEACEYLENGSLIFISANFAEKEGLLNQLMVFDSLGKLIFRQMLGNKLEAVGSGTFFVINNCLVFVANKTQLCVYELPIDF